MLKDLKVINDYAERYIKDITEYANAAQDSQHRDDILLVVEDHRSVMKDITPDGLANNDLLIKHFLSYVFMSLHLMVV